VEIVCAHLFHCRRIVLELFGDSLTVRHGDVFEHLLLSRGNVSAHCSRSILIHLHHLGRARALVPHDFLRLPLGLIHVVLGGP